MALNKLIKVPMPKHGVALRKVGGKTYAYYATATYRNEKGQPTCDRSSIGRLNEESGMLIPNRNYYEIYLKQSPPFTGGIYDYGVYYVFSNIVNKLGITALLRKYFPDNCNEILTVAQYMLSESNVMYYIDDYTQTHETFLHEPMSDVQCSKLFSSIRQEDILLFLREWIKNRKNDEYISYDVTSISSYAKNIDELKWGYNRDKEKLQQINMGMYYGESSKLPLYYRIYQGSISDKSHMKYMVNDNEFMDSKHINYVMDRGFYSAENLSFLTLNGYRFVIALPNSLKYCKDLISRHRSEIVNVSENKLGKGLPYGKCYKTTELGFSMNIHIYYDSEKALMENEMLYDLIEKQESELSLMKEPPDKTLHYDKYFYINRSKDGTLAFRRNYKAIDGALSQCGFFLIAETDFRKTSAEILSIYRNRDVVEKSFDNLKNELDFKRIHIHSTPNLYGKVFVAFIALIVKSYMINSLSESVNMTQKKILLELDKIKIFNTHSYAKLTFLNPLSKNIKLILRELEISEDFVYDNLGRI